MVLKDKIKLIRKKFKLNQQEFADILGSKIGKIKQIETGATASISFADAKLLERKYKISEQWLRFDIGDMFIEPLIKDSINEDLVALPYIEEIKLIFGVDDLAKRYIKIPSSLLLNNNLLSLEVLSFYGDSMQPTFSNNDLIIIDKDKKHLSNGKIFVVLYENELYVKRVFKMPQNKIILKSDNMYYPDIEVVTDNFRLIAQVIKVLNFKDL